MPVKVLLKEMRLKRGLSQNELARRIEMSLNAVQHIEYKAKAIQLDTLAKLCEVLDCQPGDLLVYLPNDEANQELSFEQEKLQDLEQGEEESTGETSHRRQRPHSSIKIVPELPETA
jgi:putative transcriptional regulator